MYEVIYSNHVRKFIKNLPKLKQKQIISVIERARIRPEAHFERLVGDRSYKLRAGDYKIIADIIKDKVYILIMKVGHRKNIYK